MRATRNRWAVALRIARRSALTSWGRSLLIVVLIAVPIVGLTAAAVLLPSRQSTLEERIQGTLGHAQARFTVVGTPADRVRQSVEGDDWISAQTTEEARAVDPRTVLPAGTRVLVLGTTTAVVQGAHGDVALPATAGPSWDPSLDGGPFALLSGRRPRSADEVLLSPAALHRVGARVGADLRLVRPIARTVTVVGIARSRVESSSAEDLFGSSALLGAPDPASGT